MESPIHGGGRIMRAEYRCVCGLASCTWRPVAGGPGHPPRNVAQEAPDAHVHRRFPGSPKRRFWTPGADDGSGTVSVGGELDNNAARRQLTGGPPAHVGSFSHTLTLSAKPNTTLHLCREGDEAVCVKSYARDRCYPPAIINERDSLQRVSHPLVASLLRTAKDEARIYIVTTAALGGPLYKHIREANGFAPERALYYAAQTADALAHCHQWGVLHRDVKASNVVLDEHGRAVLVDFGAAGLFDRDRPPGIDGEEKRQTYCGTPHAMAPEMVLRCGHGLGVDWWSLGILLVEMLRVTPPFTSKKPEQLAKDIRSDDCEPDLWGIDDEGSMAVVRALLNKKKPKKRRKDAERVHVDGQPIFSQDVWKVALVSPPPDWSSDLGHVAWFDDAEGPPGSPMRAAGDDDPWAGF
jgi:serine/threonine protein kinase